MKASKLLEQSLGQNSGSNFFGFLLTLAHDLEITSFQGKAVDAEMCTEGTLTSLSYIVL